jgi:hypothetical protein
MSDNNTAAIEAGATVLDPAAIDPAHPGAVHNAELYVMRGVESSTNGEAPGPDDEKLAAESPEIMIAEVEKQIARLERDLGEIVRHDPATGQPIGKLIGRARDNAERQLAVLRHTTLPYTKMRAAEIAAAKAHLPTTGDKLQAEADHKDRVRARAEELALEAEAKEMAERIRKAARSQSFG